MSVALLLFIMRTVITAYFAVIALMSTTDAKAQQSPAQAVLQFAQSRHQVTPLPNRSGGAPRFLVVSRTKRAQLQQRVFRLEGGKPVQQGRARRIARSDLARTRTGYIVAGSKSSYSQEALKAARFLAGQKDRLLSNSQSTIGGRHYLRKIADDDGNTLGVQVKTQTRSGRLFLRAFAPDATGQLKPTGKPHRISAKKLSYY